MQIMFRVDFHKEIITYARQTISNTICCLNNRKYKIQKKNWKQNRNQCYKTDSNDSKYWRYQMEASQLVSEFK